MPFVNRASGLTSRHTALGVLTIKLCLLSKPGTPVLRNKVSWKHCKDSTNFRNNAAAPGEIVCSAPPKGVAPGNPAPVHALVRPGRKNCAQLHERLLAPRQVAAGKGG
nr:MAG TPA: hypothetical protein [Bacteriophage sp.]